MKLLAYALLGCLAAALPPGAFAQTATAGATAQPQTAAKRDKALVVAPQAAPPAAAQAGPAGPRETAAGPANICRELAAFLEEQAAAPPSAAGQPGPNPAAAAAGAPAADELAKASSMAEAGDLQGCKQAARKMRRAGVNMPPALLALAALKPELLGVAKP